MLAARRQQFNLWKLESVGESQERPLIEGAVSVSRCVELALQNNRDIQLAQEDRIKADAIIQEARGEALPTLELGADYTRLDRTLNFGGIKAGSKNNYALSATLSQPLWRGGAVLAGIRGARIFSIYTDELLRGAYQDVIFEVRKAYYDARLALELEQASRKSVELAARQLEDVQKDKAAGTAAAFDVLRARVQLKNLQAAHVRAQNRYHLAVTSLLRVMNVSQESKITIQDELQFRATEPDLEASVKTAFLHHPDLLAGEYDVRVQEQAHAYARADYYPDLDATLTGQYARPEPNSPTNRNSFDTNWQMGLSVSYAIFEGFRTRARVRQALVDLRKSKLQLKDAEDEILLDIRQALFSINDAARLVESQQANVEQAEEALRLVRLGRAQGIRREVQVLDAQNALDEARANYAKAAYAHEIARLNLEKATGILDVPYKDKLPGPR